MALSRLLLAQKRLITPRKGFWEPTRRWCSSSASPSASRKRQKASSSKKSQSAKEQRTIAVESVIKKYMELNPGAFPKVSQVHEEVGGSWYLVKDIFTELKERMVRDSQAPTMLDIKIQEEIKNTKQDNTINAATDASKLENPDEASSENRVQPLDTMANLCMHQETMTREKSLVTAENLLDENIQKGIKNAKQEITVEAATQASKIEENPDEATSGNKVQPLDTMADLCMHQETMMRKESFVTIEKSLDTKIQEEIKNAKQDITIEAATEASKVEENPDEAASEDRFQSLGIMADLCMHQETVVREKSHLTVEKASDGIVEDSSNAKLVKARNEDQHSDEHSIKETRYERGQVVASQQLSIMINQIIGDIGRRHGSDSSAAMLNKGTFIENGDVPPERKVASYQSRGWKSSPSLAPASSGQRATSLAELLGTQKTDTSTDVQNSMVNSTVESKSFSNMDKATTGDDVKEGGKGLFHLFKDDAIKPQPCDILGKSNSKNGRWRHKNPRDVMANSRGLQYSDKEQKPKLNKKQAGQKASSFDFVVNDDEDNEDKSNCGSINHFDGVKELKKVPFDMFLSQFMSKVDSGSDSDVAALDYQESEPIPQIKPSGLNYNRSLYTEKMDWNYVLVKFLQKSATKENIHVAFADCGPITRICIERKKKWFNHAYVHFKTEEGLKKALAKIDAVVNGVEVVVEVTSPWLKMPDIMLAPHPIGYSNAPLALLKNPTRTVMIKGLPQDLASHHLSHALSFCGHISGFFMGSSSDIAYVEFETEDAKEKALAACTINVSGKQLSLLRLDVPQTTVVRILNVRETDCNKIHRICGIVGQINRVVRRGYDVVDVHFKSNEWANMVGILNSLNGRIVYGRHWVAQPATVIPAKVLQTLWREQDGRQYVHSVMQNLCQKIGGSTVDASKVTGLVTEYFRENA